jgi:hypothetical protein
MPSIEAIEVVADPGVSPNTTVASGVNEAGAKAGGLRCTFLTLSRVTRDDAA